MRVSKELRTAARYRQRAEELRVIAGEKSSRETRRILIDSAADYERMAGIMVGIDETKKEIGRFKISD